MKKCFMIFIDVDQEEPVYAADVYEVLRDGGLSVTRVSPITDEDGN